MKKSRRKCKYCKEYYEPKFKSTDPHPKKECIEAFWEEHKDKIIKKAEKEREAKVKREKKADKDKIKDWSKLVQSKVQEIARIVDYGQSCLARGYVPKQTHGGHLFSRGAARNMKINLHNIFAQSAQSNHFQNDDGLMRDGILREFGKDYYDFIFRLQKTPVLKLSNDEYKDLYQRACKIANRLRKGQRKLTNLERIEVRNEINLELGVYAPEFCVYKKAE